MAEPKFTPGPWDYEPGNRGDLEHYHVWCGSGVGCVCTVYPGLAPQGSSEANSRLIAVAPDLYAACEGLLALHDGDKSIVNPYVPLVRARTALAKARGEVRS